MNDGFGPEFDFGHRRDVPAAFRPTCHILYGTRVVEVCDDRPKWAGHKNYSQRM